ncbi:hypothetical protein HDF16_005251 [Granulicella aggregans]|uniref:Uncharacterized protein n=1 Tax=Granulicella aggregans TaxID=474949 RepID=A0A7W8E7Q4_9BACT|nr:hypothetical protein [Granulicella aggregans]
MLARRLVDLRPEVIGINNDRWTRLRNAEMTAASATNARPRGAYMNRSQPCAP